MPSQTNGVFDHTKRIPKFGGTIYYVSADNGADTNNGLTPDQALETIGAAIALLSAGDAISVMAGVYTDNQPDFTYLMPYETKTFSQYWWPYKKIGPVQNATKDAAVRLVVNKDGTLDLGAVVSRKFDRAHILLRDGDTTLIDERVNL